MLERPAPGFLSLRIEPGEIFRLLGANGAGKTTTNLFLNFIPPSSGTAKIGGLDVVAQSLETKRYLAYVPEQVMLTGISPAWRTWSTSQRSPASAIHSGNCSIS